MISREIKVYSALLVLLLAGAFWSWKAESSPKKAQAATLVSMLDIAADDLAAVSLKQKDGKATKVTFEGKGEERIAWVELTKPMVATTGAAAAMAQGGTRKLPGGDAATKLVEQLAPLQAVRALGKLSEKQRSQFELGDPKMTLSLETRGGRKHDMKIGGTSFGSQDYYVEDADGKVWLVKSGSVKPLLNGDGLTERTLHELDDKEIAGVAVKSGDREAAYVQQHRLDPNPKARFWSKPDAPETSETQVATWLGKARRIPVLRYPDEQPAAAAAKLSLVYTDEKGKTLAKLEVMPRDGQPPLIRSERTRLWAESDKTRVDEVLGELDAILR